jgi:hypothetical protein
MNRLPNIHVNYTQLTPSLDPLRLHEGDAIHRIYAQDGVIEVVRAPQGVALVRFRQSGERRWCQLIGMGGLSGPNSKKHSFLRYVPPVGTEVVVVFNRFRQPRVVGYHTLGYVPGEDVSSGSDDEAGENIGAEEGANGYTQTVKRVALAEPETTPYIPLSEGDWHMRSGRGGQLLLTDKAQLGGAGTAQVEVNDTQVVLTGDVVVRGGGARLTGCTGTTMGTATNPTTLGKTAFIVVEHPALTPAIRRRSAALEMGDITPDPAATPAVDDLPAAPAGKTWGAHLRVHGPAGGGPPVASLGMTRTGDVQVMGSTTALANSAGVAPDTVVLAKALCDWLEQLKVLTPMGPCPIDPASLAPIKVALAQAGQPGGAPTGTWVGNVKAH